jgi:four helix bundle protein
MTLTQPLTSTATLTLTPSLTLHLDARATQPAEPVADKSAMLSFQRLEVYQRSIEFLALALEVIAELPTKGHADIADPLRRAAQSQPLNIAEGAGRTSRPEIAKHYTIARGSAMECAAILDVMRIQQTIKPQRYERGVDLLTSVVAMLTKMI